MGRMVRHQSHSEHTPKKLPLKPRRILSEILIRDGYRMGFDRVYRLHPPLVNKSSPQHKTTLLPWQLRITALTHSNFLRVTTL